MQLNNAIWELALTLRSVYYVPVRVRPFSSKEEKDGCKCIVQMDRHQTTLIDPEFLEGQSSSRDR